MDRSRLSLLVRNLAGLRVDSVADVLRAEALMSELASSRCLHAIPVLLPMLTARVWPSTTSPTAPAHRQMLADAAAQAFATIVGTRGAREAIGVDQHLRGRSGWLYRDPAHGWSAFLRGWPAWARFDEPEYWHRWLNVRSTDVSVLEAATPHPVTTLGALSGHPDGRVRELATRRLAAHGTPAIPWLVVRTLDWVAAVRSAADRAVEALFASASAGPELIALLPLATRLRGFSRVDPRTGVQAFIERLAQEPDSVLATGLVHHDRGVRHAMLDVLEELGRLQPEHVEIVLRDRDLGVRLRAASRVGAEPTREAARLRATLWANGSARLRARALELIDEADGLEARPLLLRALDDEAIGVRERARHLLSRQAPFDARAHYRAQIERGRMSPGVILGLAEVGTPEDWDRLVPALDGSTSIARAAVAGLRRLNTSATRELRLMMVDDDRPGVSNEATRSLAREIWDSDEPVIRSSMRSSHMHVRRNAILLASRLSGWLPASLLLSIEEPALRPYVRAAFERWLARRWRQSVRPSEPVARCVREQLHASTMIAAPARESALRLLALDAASSESSS